MCVCVCACPFVRSCADAFVMLIKLDLQRGWCLANLCSGINTFGCIVCVCVGDSESGRLHGGKRGNNGHTGVFTSIFFSFEMKWFSCFVLFFNHLHSIYVLLRASVS